MNTDCDRCGRTTSADALFAVQSRGVVGGFVDGPTDHIALLCDPCLDHITAVAKERP